MKKNCKTKTNQKTLVVPITMIVEGVLNDCLLTVEAFSKNFQAWNGRPVVVYHPELDGRSVSAHDSPEIADKYVVGTLYNARIENSKLRADAHIELERLCKIGHCKLADRLKADEKVEVSTGYFSDDEQTSGEFNGFTYSVKSFNLVPDHLALLPDEIGACSIKDGCGTFQTNFKRSKGAVTMSYKQLMKKLKINELDEETEKVLETISDEQVEALLEAVEEIEPEPSTNLSEEVLAAIADLSDDELAKLLAEIKKPNGNEEDKDELTANKVQKMIADATEKARLVERLHTNKACAFSEKELTAMSINELKIVEKQAGKAPKTNSTDFSAAAGGGNGTQTEIIVNAAAPKGLVAKLRGDK